MHKKKEVNRDPSKGTLLTVEYGKKSDAKTHTYPSRWAPPHLQPPLPRRKEWKSPSQSHLHRSNTNGKRYEIIVAIKDAIAKEKLPPDAGTEAAGAPVGNLSPDRGGTSLIVAGAAPDAAEETGNTTPDVAAPGIPTWGTSS